MPLKHLPPAIGLHIHNEINYIPPLKLRTSQADNSEAICILSAVYELKLTAVAKFQPYLPLTTISVLTTTDWHLSRRVLLKSAILRRSTDEHFSFQAAILKLAISSKLMQIALQRHNLQRHQTIQLSNIDWSFINQQDEL